MDFTDVTVKIFASLYSQVVGYTHGTAYIPTTLPWLTTVLLFGNLQPTAIMKWTFTACLIPPAAPQAV